MEEILPGLYHWTTFHEGIGQDVHSYYVSDADPPYLIDPRAPGEGIGWFEARGAPRNAYLTNRLLVKSFRRILRERSFDAVLFAHGDPIVKGGKKELRRFLRGLREFSFFLHFLSLTFVIVPTVVHQFCRLTTVPVCLLYLVIHSIISVNRHG